MTIASGSLASGGRRFASTAGRPREAAVTPGIRPGEPQPDAGAPVTIVVIDDHAIVRQGLRSLLERERDLQVVGDCGSPGEALVVTECAAKGAATGPGDCDLTNMQSVTSDANGELTTQFTVHKGPFGANNIICGPSQACLVSVTQATLSPTQEADARISFA